MKGGGIVQNHYNLYYLFLEDKLQNHMEEKARDEIQKNLENLYKKIKPGEKTKPLNSIRKKEQEEKRIYEEKNKSINGSTS